MKRQSACVLLPLLLCVALAQPASAMPLAGPAREWVPSQIQPTTIPLKWSRATLDDKVALDELGRRPVVDPDELVWLLACERPTQLDCVESIGLVSASGQYRPGRWNASQTFDVTWRESEGIAPYAHHETFWEVPGLVVNGVNARIRFVGNLGGVSPLGTPGLNMDLAMWDVPLKPSTPDSPRGCPFIHDGECLAPPDYPPGTTLRVVLRTSWLAPSGVTARGTNVTVGVEDLGGGAHRFSITGKPMLAQSRGGRKEVVTGKPQWVVSTFYFKMIDPRLTDEFGSECAINRPIVVSANAQEFDLPIWDQDAGRLNLTMESPHYWSDRKTVWRGFYETSMPGATARCLWGVDPRITNYLSVEVYAEDGDEKAATTAVNFRAGVVRIRAAGFTFSKSTVSARVKVVEGQSCFTAGVRIRDLTCADSGGALVWAKA